MNTETECPEPTRGAQVAVLLPARSATDEQVQLTAKSIQQRVGAAATPELKEVLSESRRRASSPGLSERSRQVYASLVSTINDELVRRQIDEREHAVRAVEEKQPMRRRVLERLLVAPTTSTDLAAIIGARPETVSRTLTAMARDGLVRREPDTTDGRRWLYAPAEVTSDGLAALAEHRAFSAVTTAPALPTPADVRRHLCELLGEAVRERRLGQRDAAVGRLEIVVREAEERQLCDLELRGRRELMTTLRQDKRWEQLLPHLHVMEDFQLGRRQALGPVAAIAAAHANYERGRINPDGKQPLSELFRLLIAADVGYSQLAGEQPDEPEWRNRHGWTALSIADNLRQQTQFGRALHHIDIAERVFDEDDFYGRARLLVLRGFCLRLRGQFRQANVALVEALDLIWANKFEPFEADARAQLGEVQRCLGEHDASVKHFAEAETIGAKLHLHTTHAFAESGRGAVAFALGYYEDAVRLFDSSSTRFARAGQPLGEALTLRRLATACRYAQRSEFDGRTVPELHLQATRLYSQMRSPAGLATTIIERGRWEQQKDDNRGLEQSCQQLTRLILGDRANHALLRLDPCVPSLIDGFADDCGTVELRDAAAQLLEDVEARKASSPRALDDAPSELDAEMACEPRCDADDGRWLSAVIATAVSAGP